MWHHDREEALQQFCIWGRPPTVHFECYQAAENDRYCCFYIESHGLHFNPTKTECMVYGRNPFKTTPDWTISGKRLVVKPSLTYLGTVLDGSVGPRRGLHTESRIRASQKAYFSLQGSGLHKKLDPQTALSVYNAAVRTPLLYGCLSVKLLKTNLKSLDKQQAKQIKCMLGLNLNRSHTTPLLEALKTIFKQSLDLLRRCFLNNSNARSFYSFVLTNSENFKKYISRTFEGVLIPKKHKFV